MGEPGIGKTTVWSHVLTSLDVGWSWSVRCVEVEANIGLAVLADLFAAVPIDVVDALAPPQRRALDIVLYRADGADLGRIGERLLGATSLGLLRALAERGSVVLGIDDVQWCDPTSLNALTFALHRLDNRWRSWRPGGQGSWSISGTPCRSRSSRCRTMR